MCLASDIAAYEFEPSDNCTPVETGQTETTEEAMQAAITLSGSDADSGDILSFVIASLPSNGTLSDGTIEIAEAPYVLSGDTVMFMPDTPFTGVDCFRFRLSDGTDESNIANVRVVTVNATAAVTKTADTNEGACDADCSLREAIIAANAREGADTIAAPAGTYALSIGGSGEDGAQTGDPDINDELTINGPGAGATIIDGGGLDRVFHVTAFGRVYLSHMTIRNGDVVDQGGGISNRGILSLSDSVVSGNSSGSSGGGIWNEGSLGVSSSTITGNSAEISGGGIFGGGTIVDSTVNDNTAVHDGGGLVGGVLTRTVVRDNYAWGNGGGIFNPGPINSSVVSRIPPAYLLALTLSGTSHRVVSFHLLLGTSSAAQALRSTLCLDC